jgi:hypothetical protein
VTGALTLEGAAQMVDPQEPRSAVVPVLVAALVCDVAVADPSTGKKNLIGIFDVVHADRFPTLRPMSVYIKLADAMGYYQLSLEYVKLEDDQKLAEASGELRSTDRLASVDLYISFPPMVIPAPGRYEFRVFANDVFLGSAFLDAKDRSTQQEGGERS